MRVVVGVLWAAVAQDAEQVVYRVGSSVPSPAVHISSVTEPQIAPNGQASTSVRAFLLLYKNDNSYI